MAYHHYVSYIPRCIFSYMVTCPSLALTVVARPIVWKLCARPVAQSHKGYTYEQHIEFNGKFCFVQHIKFQTLRNYKRLESDFLEMCSGACYLAPPLPHTSPNLSILYRRPFSIFFVNSCIIVEEHAL